MAWPMKYETGVTHDDREKTFDGYTLITYMPARDAAEAYEVPCEVFLMDMQGAKVHSWKTPYPAWYSRLTTDGHLVTAMRYAKATPERPGYGDLFMGGATGMLMELDWEGNIVFEHFDPNMHHDFRKLPNGNYIYVGWERVPADLAKKVRGGQKGTELKGGIMYCDYFREVDASGQSVWEWHGFEHFDPDIDIIGAIHPREEWTHVNDVDVMPDGNILSDTRHTDGAFIIDRDSGEIIWRWGNVAYLDPETGLVEHRNFRENDTLGGPHDTHLIAEGLPGEGNMLVYDNGMYRYHSRAVEVDIRTGEVVWESDQDYGLEGYTRGRIHFSPFISSADRMPNGNTVICAGGNGVVFEVTMEKEVVWQWVRAEPNFEGEVHWAIFRAHRFGTDYCPQFQQLPPARGD